MDQIYGFLRRHKFPRTLAKSVVHFFRVYYKEKNLIDERAIMEVMPSKMLKEVKACVVQDKLRQQNFFRRMPAKYFPEALHLLHPLTVEQGAEIISAHEDPGPEFFCIVQGCVGIYKPKFVESGAEDDAETMSHQERLDKFKATALALYGEIDKDGNGELDRDELKRMLTSLAGGKFDVSDEQVTAAMDAIDTDRSNTISLDEFSEWYVRSHIEIPHNRRLGALLSTLQPTCMFGVWAAFNLGSGKSVEFTYIALEMCELFSINAEHLMDTFRDVPEVLGLIEEMFVGPARNFGSSVDLYENLDLTRTPRPSASRAAWSPRTRAAAAPRESGKADYSLRELVGQLQECIKRDAAVMARVKGVLETMDLDQGNHGLLRQGPESK